MLVAERFVEGVRVAAAVGGVEDDVPGAPRPGLGFDRAHQELADSAAAEPLADDERGHLAAELVTLDEILGMERAETGDLALDLGDVPDRRRVGGDALEPLGCLLASRRVPELAEQRRDRTGILLCRLAKRYGGGGGASGGGASSSTYVVLLRPHPPR